MHSNDYNDKMEKSTFNSLLTTVLSTVRDEYSTVATIIINYLRTCSVVRWKYVSALRRTAIDRPADELYYWMMIFANQ